MDLETELPQNIISTKKKVSKEKKNTKQKKESDKLLIDNYTRDILSIRFTSYKRGCEELNTIINEKGLPIRHQNPPEDVTENIVKFIIQNYDNDLSCKWAKGVGIKGDLYSDKYDVSFPIEVKAFTSNGPSQFGPKKKFGVLYFLDMRNWLSDRFILWKVNLTSESPEIKQIKMNKTQTHEEQCSSGRRPHISWDKLYPQIMDYCVKVFEGPFEDIFTLPVIEPNA
jgi:hypothetical protein